MSETASVAAVWPSRSMLTPPRVGYSEATSADPAARMPCSAAIDALQRRTQSLDGRFRHGLEQDDQMVDPEGGVRSDHARELVDRPGEVAIFGLRVAVRIANHDPHRPGDGGGVPTFGVEGLGQGRQLPIQ